MTANERDSGVYVVHECLSERGGGGGGFYSKRPPLVATASESARQLMTFSG